MMLERMLGIEVEAIELQLGMPVSIEHKAVQYHGTIHIKSALDGIGTLNMTTLPTLAGSKYREEKNKERKCFFQLTINN